MTTNEVAAELIKLCSENQYMEAIDKLYADDIVSVEAVDFGQGRETRGKEAVKAKSSGWFSAHEVHKATVNGPYVSVERFAVRFAFDFTRKATGERVQFSELASTQWKTARSFTRNSCTARRSEQRRFAALLN